MTSLNRGLKLNVPHRRLACFIMALIAGMGLSKTADAHPHVWVSVKTEILYTDDGKISGFGYQWTFDEFYSSFATQGLDKNGDGKFDKAELEELAKVNVTSLSEFDYFTFPKKGEVALERGEPKDYWLEHKDGVLTLHFTLPLKENYDVESAPLSLAVYDPTYYIAFDFAKETPVVQSKNAPANCVAKLVSPEGDEQQTASLTEAFMSDANNAFSVATSMAQDVVVSCSK